MFPICPPPLPLRPILFTPLKQAAQDADSFEWIMDQFKDMRGPDAPPIEVGFSDQDPAIAKAFAKAFPDMHHLLCVWHLLGKNLVTNMKGHFTSKCDKAPCRSSSCWGRAVGPHDRSIMTSQIQPSFDLCMDVCVLLSLHAQCRQVMALRSSAEPCGG
jgi:hypothetical protein